MTIHDPSHIAKVGKTFRVGNAVDATVTQVTYCADGSTLLRVAWWWERERNEETVCLLELGPEVVHDGTFGFRPTAKDDQCHA